jgi:predicted dehydrogenase
MFNNSSIGILGAGFMAEEYLKVLASKNIFCEAIYSRTFSKALKLKKIYKIKKICKTLKEFNNLKNIKGIIIAVNESSVLTILNSINLNKFKILCEKPVGINYLQSKIVKNLLKKNRSKFFVSLNRRFYCSTIKAKKILKKNKKKRFIYINDQQIQNHQSKLINKNKMYSNSVHLIDYMSIFARGRIKKIKKIKKFKYKEQSETLCKLFFSRGAVVLYCCNWNSAGGWYVNIIQDYERLELKPLEQLMHEKIFNNRIVRKKYNADKIDITLKPGLYLQILEFLKLINNKKNSLVSFEEYYKTVEIIKKIYV